MDEKTFKKLLSRYLHGTASESEKSLVRKYYQYFQQKEKANWTEWEQKNAEKMGTSIRQYLLESIKLDHHSVRKEANYRFKMHLRIAASITVFLAVSLVAYLYLWPSLSTEIVATDTHQRRAVRLPDGSLVTLNTASQLTYPKWFLGSNREVKLTGEAFFDVQHDESKPFIVKSGKVVTTVLGTSFNISAHPDENISVSVATGRVRVEKVNDQHSTSKGKKLKANSQQLLPGDQAFFDTQTKQLTKATTDMDIILAWQTKTLHFDRTLLSKAVAMLEAKYQVNILLDDEKLKQKMIFHASYAEEPLNEILTSLGVALDFEFEYINEKQIRIK